MSYYIYALKLSANSYFVVCASVKSMKTRTFNVSVVHRKRTLATFYSGDCAANLRGIRAQGFRSVCQDTAYLTCQSKRHPTITLSKLWSPFSFPPAAAAAAAEAAVAAGRWWHIWPIIGGSGEDDVSWKLVHTWRVSRRPAAAWWRAVGEKNSSIAELSSLFLSSFLLSSPPFIRGSVANQRLLLGRSILPLNFPLLLHG